MGYGLRGKYIHTLLYDKAIGDGDLNDITKKKRNLGRRAMLSPRRKVKPMLCYGPWWGSAFFRSTCKCNSRVSGISSYVTYLETDKEQYVDDETRSHSPLILFISLPRFPRRGRFLFIPPKYPHFLSSSSPPLSPHRWHEDSVSHFLASTIAHLKTYPSHKLFSFQESWTLYPSRSSSHCLEHSVNSRCPDILLSSSLLQPLHILKPIHHLSYLFSLQEAWKQHTHHAVLLITSSIQRILAVLNLPLSSSLLLPCLPFTSFPSLQSSFPPPGFISSLSPPTPLATHKDEVRDGEDMALSSHGEQG